MEFSKATPKELLRDHVACENDEARPFLSYIIFIFKIKPMTLPLCKDASALSEALCINGFFLFKLGRHFVSLDY